MIASNDSLPLQNLARAYGVETDYRDNLGRRQGSSQESLLAVLKSLGAPIETPEDVPDARRERRQSYWRQCIEPVIVAWDDACPDIELRLPTADASGTLHCDMTLGTGKTRRLSMGLESLHTTQQTVVEGASFTAKALRIPQALPSGYHRLRIEVPGQTAEAMIISAPSRAYCAFPEMADRVWGAFLPLYALSSKRSWGAGDFTDLETLMEWVQGLGGNAVATLPFLASFLDKPCDPSPYTPVSRLFWNEFYLDVAGVPEMASCPEARAIAEATDFQQEIAVLRDARLVDYRRQMALRRRVLEKLAASLTPESGERYRAFRRFLEEHGRLPDYARFRATVESRGETWPAWPERLRNGALGDEDYGAGAEHYHAYVQWLADEQLHQLSSRTRAKGLRLYLDLPLGVHREGYDTWREGDLFVPGVAAGAPPDALFHKGQNWGFPPLHPQKLREQAYRYPIAYLAHHMRYADVLRADHVMGLHHLYWVPEGMEATQGVYVRYPADEMYAVLSVESHRHRCTVVGENLGTVPGYVNEAMGRHGVSGLYVVQYEVRPGPDEGLGDVPATSVSSLNTHDMPPFAAFWRGLEIERWQAMGLITEDEGRTRVEDRHAAKRNLVRFLERSGYLTGDREDVAVVLRACLSFLAHSPAQVFLVNMEDLWLETEQQNVPGVVDGHPNWQRKARYDFDTFSTMPEALDLLRNIKRQLT